MAIEFEPIWFDSLGAKSMATYISTPDVKILIDPGAAEMQPGFPAPSKLKKQWKQLAREKIKRFLKQTDIVIISHYHHDHYLWEEDDLVHYAGKILYVKDPNRFINQSQRERAEEFFLGLIKIFGLKSKIESTFPEFDPMDGIEKERLIQLYGEKFYSKGLKWLEKLSNRWNDYEKIPEFEGENLKVIFAEGRQVRFGDTLVKFTPPEFHGIEFSKTGWVFSIVIEHGGEKLLHTSDLCGPVIESRADWIISKNPDYLIVDGPMTYTLGYLLSGTTLIRAVENMVRILEKTEPQVVIYDHHLLREKNFREHTRRVWEFAKQKGIILLTAAEFMGKRPVIKELTELSGH